MIELIRGEDGIAVLLFDTPGEKVNLLDEASVARLATLLDSVERDASAGSIRGLVIASAKPATFIAGADVKAFVEVAATGDAAAAAAKARAGQALFSRVAALPVPAVAAINGACLGGGLELALACRARVAGDGTEVTIGLPEVRLGLIPGWGGTQRLPRLIGPTRALDLILTGRSLSGRQALRMGLVGRVAPQEGIRDAARAEALRLAGGGAPRRPAFSALDRSRLTRALLFSMARRRTLRQTHGHYPAPLAAIEAIRYGFERSIEAGLAREAELVGRLLVSDVSKNLVQIFLSSRAPAGGSGGDAPARRAESIGVIGAGTMGGGIAAVAALSGIPVRLRDVNAEALGRGMAQVARRAKGSARKGRFPRHEAARRANLVAPTIDWSGFSRCDLIVEAVVEDLEVKREVLRRVESVTPDTALFATNTSSLSVADIAAASSRPAGVLGLHFFNPVEKMPLVEVVRGPATDPAAVEAGVRLARKMGKTPVVVSDTPGFIVNRILMPYLAGAMRIVCDSGRGADVVPVDRAMVAFGMPMGPFALLDRIGLDVAGHVAGVLSAAFPGREDDADGSRLLHAMTQAGRLGVKSGGGFYRYPKGSATPRGVAADLDGLLAAVRGSDRTTVPAPAEAEIVERLTDAMIDEAARLLESGAVEGPAVIDIAMIFGAGFPPFRGGLLRHADTVGPGKIAARIRERGGHPAATLSSKERFYA